MEYRVERVGNRRTMKDFIRLPRLIYRGDPNWIAPLESEIRRVLDVKLNPYFTNGSVELFICYADNAVSARIAIIINRAHCEKFGTKTAFFGFFECVNDTNAAYALFGRVEQYCLEHGIDILEGPFNPNHYSELGLQFNKFGTTPSFFQTYNPEYYSRLIEQAGFEMMKIVHTRKRQNISDYIRQRYGDTPTPTASSDYTVRNFRKDDFDNDLEHIRDVFNDAFSNNWHFLPLSKEEYLFSAKFLNLVTKPELITIVEHNGEPVGVLECVQDINPLLKRLHGKIGPIKFLQYQWERRKIKNLIIYAVGIKIKYQRTRVFKLLLDAMCRLSLNYNTLECTWTSDDNPLAIKAAKHLGLERDKEFAVYQKQLTKS
jgi:hypothetical protein